MAHIPTMAANSPPSGSVRLSGTARSGLLLLATPELADPDGLGGFMWRWQSSTDGMNWAEIPGATTNAFTLTEAQVGLRVRAVADYVDQRGTRESVASAASEQVLLFRQGSHDGEPIVGVAAPEAIDALGGDDLVFGGGGNDRIDGGTGTDTAVYLMTRDNYGVARSGNYYFVNAGSGDEGSDRLINVERLQFSDSAVALDLEGRAGTAVRLLGTVWGPAAVANEADVGVGLALLDAGITDLELAQLAVELRFANGVAHDEFVRTLYMNATGTEVSASDLARWTAMLDSGEYTLAAMALEASQTPQVAASINLAGLAASGVEYTPF